MGDAADSCGSTGATSTYTYSTGTHTPIDALTAQTGPSHTYSYDGAGSTSGDGMTTGNGTDTYNWDTQLRLKGSIDATGSVCYRYSPDGTVKTRTYDSTGNGSCTTATKTTNYLLGDLYETNGGGTIITSSTDSPNGELAEYTGSPTSSHSVTYLHYNAHGDLASESDPTGYATATHTYDPFGTPTDTPPPNTTSHRYTGASDKPFDSTNSLILMGARPYTSTLGRFLSVDPVDGGSLNNYDYVSQDPLNQYDPTGQCGCGNAPYLNPGRCATHHTASCGNRPRSAKDAWQPFAALSILLAVAVAPETLAAADALTMRASASVMSRPALARIALSVEGAAAADDKWGKPGMKESDLNAIRGMGAARALFKSLFPDGFSLTALRQVLHLPTKGPR